MNVEVDFSHMCNCDLPTWPIPCSKFDFMYYGQNRTVCSVSANEAVTCQMMWVVSSALTNIL